MGDIENWQYSQSSSPPTRRPRWSNRGSRHYSEFILFPETLDAALARRRIELENVEVRSVCFTRVPQVVKVDPERRHFIMSDYHFGMASRRLHDQNLCNYIPMTYHMGPRTIRKYIYIDVFFLVTGPMDPRGFFNFGIGNSVTAACCRRRRRSSSRSTRTFPSARRQPGVHPYIQDRSHSESANASLLEVPPASRPKPTGGSPPTS